MPPSKPSQRHVPKDSLFIPMSQPNQRHVPAKGSLSVLVTLQLIVAVSLFVENSLNLTKNTEHFESEESKDVVFAAWLMFLLWLITILVAFAAIFTNSYNFLLPHLIFTSLLFVLCVLCSIILLLSDTRPWTMIFSTGISVLLGVTIVSETKCYFAMRKYLR
ncbi:unnamed protein product [Cylicocyclus nassatus]|uniref:Uncharacterized protein n=1 Tax=Cylicocyclus nassatus TaxID=53992 RepID=A0AA36MC68_CYLNA|nr:unnamed protein product [Cylicocyclus nassatus]